MELVEFRPGGLYCCPYIWWLAGRTLCTGAVVVKICVGGAWKSMSRSMGSPAEPSRRHLFGLAAGGGLASLVPGCASPERGPAVPTGHAGRASVLGLPNERFYPLLSVQPLEAEFIAALGRQRLNLGLAPDAAM